ncbi:MAG: hypothetical protein R3B84_17710 [Zavarzinella sp.]
MVRAAPMKRWFITGIVSLVWGVLSAFPAAYIARAVERSWYPNDPDPVDFWIGGIFILVWFIFWLIVTSGLIVWTVRSRHVA